MRTLNVWSTVAGMIFCVAATSAKAQLCHGSPPGISVAYEHGTTSAGSSEGIVATLRAIQLGARIHEVGPNFTGQEGSLRFSLGLGSSRVQVCPMLGVAYGQDTWDYAPGSSLDMKTLTARGGGGIGFLQPVYKDLAINPFIVVQYQFSAMKFEDAAVDDGEFSADTLSDVDIEYGLVAHYRFLYAGVAAHRFADDEGLNPYLARWIFGFSFSGLRKSSNRHERQVGGVRRPGGR